MTPELPVELSQRVILNELRSEVLECSMIRAGARCGNDAGATIFYPSTNGCYNAIAICNTCVSQLPDGWLPSLEALITKER